MYLVLQFLLNRQTSKILMMVSGTVFREPILCKNIPKLVPGVGRCSIPKLHFLISLHSLIRPFTLVVLGFSERIGSGFLCVVSALEIGEY